MLARDWECEELVDFNLGFVGGVFFWAWLKGSLQDHDGYVRRSLHDAEVYIQCNCQPSNSRVFFYHVAKS